MSEIDESAREDGRCGYIGDGRETPCQLVEGWGYDNASTGLCRNHGERGGQEGNQNAKDNPGGGAPDENDNAVTHGAFREQFTSHLTDAEEQAFADAFEQLGTPEGPRTSPGRRRPSACFNSSVRETSGFSDASSRSARSSTSHRQRRWTTTTATPTNTITTTTANSPIDNSRQ